MLDRLNFGQTSGGGGAWQHAARPLDANADDDVDAADLSAVAGVLAAAALPDPGYWTTGPLAGIAAVHARLRGGADLALPYLLQDPPEIWLFGGPGDDFCPKRQTLACMFLQVNDLRLNVRVGDEVRARPGRTGCLAGKETTPCSGWVATMSWPARRGTTSWSPGRRRW